jgi:hypothetical protein
MDDRRTLLRDVDDDLGRGDRDDRGPCSRIDLASANTASARRRMAWDSLMARLR